MNKQKIIDEQIRQDIAEDEQRIPRLMTYLEISLKQASDEATYIPNDDLALILRRSLKDRLEEIIKLI
jgi:hypothetical protein